MGKQEQLLSIILFAFGTLFIAYLTRDYLFLSNNPYHALAIGGVLLIPSGFFLVWEKSSRDRAKRFNQYFV